MAGYKYYYGYNSENEALPDDQRIPRQDYLEYKPGDTAATKSETHKPIVILRWKINYETETDPAQAPAGYDNTISLDQRHEPKQGEPLHLCCDIIQIIYGDFDLSDRDPLFEEAARLLVSHQQGSTSLIQRKEFPARRRRAGAGLSCSIQAPRRQKSGAIEKMWVDKNYIWNRWL